MKIAIQNFGNEIIKLEEDKIKLCGRVENAQNGKEETVNF